MPMSTVSAMASTPPNSISLYEMSATTNATMHSRLRRIRHAICSEPVQSTTTSTTSTHATQMVRPVDMIASTCVAMDTKRSETMIALPTVGGATWLYRLRSTCQSLQISSNSQAPVVFLKSARTETPMNISLQ